jgi:hypothetical protein
VRHWPNCAPPTRTKSWSWSVGRWRSPTRRRALPVPTIPLTQVNASKRLELSS